MDHLPLFVRIAARPCVLVGGGEVALRKARLLVRAGGRLRVIAPDIGADLEALALGQEGELHRRAFTAADLQDPAIALVVAATDDAAVNAAVSEAAQARGLLVNVVDSASESNALFPSIVDRSPIVLAIGSGGQSPVLLRQWRERLEALLPARLGDLASLAGRFRAQVREVVRDPTARRRFWEQVFDGPVSERALAGDADHAERLLAASLAPNGPGEARDQVRGEVYIVGAGPGAPDLLTLRALQLMQRADVILHDQLASMEVLDLARRDAVRIPVGKRGRAGGESQARIHRLMLEHARAGARVLRLKGGDPTIFGRLGEEMDALIAAGIPFQVVPGVSAGNGAAAIAGIPLTDRTLAQSVRFVTALLRGGEPNLDWPELAKPGQTLVVYMGGARMASIFAQLVAHGRAPSTPVAVIESGTLRDERVQVTDLGSPDAVAPSSGGPVLLIIGEVVRYHGATTAVGALDEATAAHAARADPDAAPGGRG
jgi:uroporphyrin-III C-methyltransferase/precorrin-2 dehydrogenase/sirohydrochlorin ferrochelatase